MIGVAALTAAASPNPADTLTGHNPVNETTLTLDLSQIRAANATAQAAVTFELDDAQNQATEQALRTAQQRKAQDDARSAAARAARAREAAARAAQQGQTPSATPGTPSTGSSSTVSSVSGSISKVLDFLKQQVGKQYVLGGTGPYAYDCSGLAQAAFRTIGVDLPRTSEEQSNVGTPVSLGSLQPGDLLFWGGRGGAYHVAVYIGGDYFTGAENPSEGIVTRPLSWDPPSFAMRVA